MAGPLLTFTNEAVWVFGFVFGAFTRNALEVTGLGTLIIYCVFWCSDFAITTVVITEEIELWYHVQLPVVLLLSALAGQEFSRMFQIPRLITFSSPMPYDFKSETKMRKVDPANDWFIQLFGLTGIALALGINFWAGRTIAPPKGLSPVGTDLSDAGIIIAVMAAVVLIIWTVILLILGSTTASIAAKYLWLSIPIPLMAIIQTYAQYNWNWNNGYPELLWYGLLTVAFLVVTVLSMLIPVGSSTTSMDAVLIDVFHTREQLGNTKGFAWIYFGTMYAVVVIGSLIFNGTSQWRQESPAFGSYILMGWSAFVILGSVIVGAILFHTFEKLPGWEYRSALVNIDGEIKKVDMAKYLEESSSEL
jgi:hypothetical protein